LQRKESAKVRGMRARDRLTDALDRQEIRWVMAEAPGRSGEDGEKKGPGHGYLVGVKPNTHEVRTYGERSGFWRSGEIKSKDGAGCTVGMAERG